MLANAFRPACYDLCKRAGDVVMASLALLILSPVFMCTALAVKFALGSPVLLRQVRPGRFGRPFVLFKFRSMTEAKDSSGNLLPDEMRLTRFGAWLRKSSLDELPQLINVVRGDMSLVGPRPLLMEYLSLYTAEQSRRHEVLPGVTGLAQVNGRNDTTWADRLRLDVWYVEHRSFLLDFVIVLKTLRSIACRKGVSHACHVTMPRFTGETGDGRD